MSEDLQMSNVAKARQLTITEKLLKEKHILETRLREVNKALSALEENPEFQKIFDLISKTVRY